MSPDTFADISNTFMQYIQTVKASSLLWFATGFIIIVFGIVSFMLVYHWRRYEVGNDHANRMMLIYFSVSIVLIAAAVTSHLSL